MEKTKLEFLELVYYCVNKCRATTLNIFEAIAEFFNELGGHFCEVSLFACSSNALPIYGFTLIEHSALSDIFFFFFWLEGFFIH